MIHENPRYASCETMDLARAQHLMLTATNVRSPVVARRLSKQASTCLVLGSRLRMADSENPNLDKVQVGLDIAGVVPIVGEAADLVNALISLARGDYFGATLSLISMIPEAGDAVGKGGKLVIWFNKLLKQQGNVGKAARAVAKYGPKLRWALVTGAKAIKQYEGTIRKALKFIDAVVSAEPGKALNLEGVMGQIAKLLNNSKMGKALRAKIEPYISKLPAAFEQLVGMADKTIKALPEKEIPEYQQPQAQPIQASTRKSLKIRKTAMDLKAAKKYALQALENGWSWGQNT